jgi:hypothetical protein
VEGRRDKIDLAVWMSNLGEVDKAPRHSVVGKQNSVLKGSVAEVPFEYFRYLNSLEELQRQNLRTFSLLVHFPASSLSTS